MSKRLLDIFASFSAIILLIVPLFICAVLVRISSPGPSLYWSERVGQGNRIFKMPKLRTMYLATPQVPTDRLDNPNTHITWLGRHLRKTSIDELPQLFSVLIGDMSLVGPRPLLASQRRILDKRKRVGVDEMKPGITGWAQINGRDNLTENEKVSLDLEYKERQSVFFDLQIMWRTIFYVWKSKGVWH